MRRMQTSAIQSTEMTNKPKFKIYNCAINMTMSGSHMRPPILTSNIFANNLYKITIFIYVYVYHPNKTLRKLQWCSTSIYRIITDLRCDGHCATIYMYRLTYEI